MVFTDWNKQQWIDFGSSILWVVVSFLLFRTLQFVVRWYLFGKCTYRTFNYFGLRANAGRNSSRNSDSRDLSAIPPNKKWRISNEAVSLGHSIVSGLWAAYALLYYKQLMTDLVFYRCETAIYLIFLSTGYLLHDLLDLLVNEQSARIIELLFHHVVVLSAFAITMISQRFLGVVIFGLLMELNSIFLHSRSLLNLYGIDKKSPSFRIIALLNMVTLFFFRLCVSVYLIYFAATSAFDLPWYQAVVNSVVILSLFITNSVLTYRLMAADGLLERFGVKATGRSRRRSKPISSERTTQTSDIEANPINTALENSEKDPPSPEDSKSRTSGAGDVKRAKNPNRVSFCADEPPLSDDAYDSSSTEEEYFY